MDVDINGITVIFPHKPYPIQIDYMRSVITSLQQKQNALLESPTGTGKTLSLLCSSLAWLEHRKYQDLELLKNNSELNETNKEEKQITQVGNNGNGKTKGGKGWKNENPIRIIYSSRTHSQLNQVCAELKNSYYKFTPTVTIGSRDQLCIDPEVRKLESIAAKNQTCRQKVKNNTCKFHNNYERKVSDLSFSGSKVYDIEDLVKFGEENKACPYYLAKAKSDFNTSLVFMPYNYVLDPNIRKTLSLNLENCVIIFDEGHNIESVCEDSMSTEMKSEWLALFITTFDNALQSLKLLEEGKYDGTNEKDLNELNIHDIAQVKVVMCDLEAELDRMVKHNKAAVKSYHQTEEIFQIFERIGLDYAKFGLITASCEKLITYIMNSATSYMNNAIISALSSICSFIEIVMPFSNAKGVDLKKFKSEFIKNYKLYSEIENEENSWSSKNTWKKKTENTWTIYLWCMSPSVAIKSLLSMGVYNLIITSGTLAPLESFESEMATPFPVKLQNSHVISKNQLSIQFIFKDPNGNDLSGSYENRNDVKYYNGLALTIIELSRTVPKGMFIFFSSYSLINKCIDMWKNRPGISLWQSISSLKRIFVEPKSKNEFNEAMQAFKETVDTTRDGAIFMGVSRGKLSEGIDLGDDYCRAVVIVGLPYPARYDPKVVLKQKYLDENNFKLTGIKWYMLQMKRALNQSIGRVVRHKNDYGSIIICDSRFRQLNDGLSKWIQAFLTGNMHASMNADFKTKLRDIQNFYKQIESASIPNIERSGQSKSITSVPTSSDKKRQICSANVESNASVNIIESTLDSIRSGYICSTTMATKRPNDHLEANSIFDTFGYSNGSAKKRPNDDKSGSNIYLENNTRNNNVIKKDFLKDEHYFKSHQLDNSEKGDHELTFSSNANKSRNDKMKLISHYFARSNSGQDAQSDMRSSHLNNKGSSHVAATKLEYKENATLKTGPSSTFSESSSHCQPASNKPSQTTTDTIDFKSEEIVSLRNSLFPSNQGKNTFDSIVNEIKGSLFKSRQFVETLRIYGKKRSCTYLALRLNFILDVVPINKRNVILKDMSLSLPERERKQFLSTCKVDI